MNRSDLMNKGFDGFLPVSEIDERQLQKIPQLAGVYVVVCDEPLTPPSFLPKSQGGWFKGKDPTVPLAVIQQRWVAGTGVLYIGKADNLRRRIKQLCRYAAGEPVGHWGGRLLWQVEGCHKFRVAWRADELNRPFASERALMNEFSDSFGCLPFANLQGPRLKD